MAKTAAPLHPKAVVISDGISVLPAGLAYRREWIQRCLIAWPSLEQILSEIGADTKPISKFSAKLCENVFFRIWTRCVLAGTVDSTHPDSISAKQFCDHPSQEQLEGVLIAVKLASAEEAKLEDTIRAAGLDPAHIGPLKGAKGLLGKRASGVVIDEVSDFDDEKREKLLKSKKKSKQDDMKTYKDDPNFGSW